MVKNAKNASDSEFEVGKVVGVRLGADVVRGVVVEDRGLFGPNHSHVVRISVQVTGSTATTLEVLTTSLTDPPAEEKLTQP
jgi:hypothetical protein